jgi:hypothetical protein
MHPAGRRISAQDPVQIAHSAQPPGPAPLCLSLAGSLCPSGALRFAPGSRRLRLRSSTRSQATSRAPPLRVVAVVRRGSLPRVVRSGGISASLHCQSARAFVPQSPYALTPQGQGSVRCEAHVPSPFGGPRFRVTVRHRSTRLPHRLRYASGSLPRSIRHPILGCSTFRRELTVCGGPPAARRRSEAEPVFVMDSGRHRHVIDSCA